MMIGNFWVDAIVVVIKFLIPAVALLSLILSLKPQMFVELEKKLSSELGMKKGSRKTVASLEKENLALQTMLLRNSRATGMLCFVFSVILLFRMFL